MFSLIFHSTYSKPIILIGNGARTAGAIDEITSFALKHNIPILTTMIAVDASPESYHFGFIGTHGNRTANLIIGECDLLISIGARLGIRQVGKFANQFAKKAKLIRVDIDEAELSRNIKQDEIKIQMDAKTFMELLKKEKAGNYEAWLNKCIAVRDFLESFDLTEGNLAIKEISKLLPKNSIVAVDVGQNQCWAAQSLRLKGNNSRILIGGGYGTMGCGLPFAIGACFAANKQPVFCIRGDGGFQMNIQELEVLARDHLPIKIFILNNRVLGKISETQHNNHNDRFEITTKESGYSVPDFEKIASAYGIKAYRLENFALLSDYKDEIEMINKKLEYMGIEYRNEFSEAGWVYRYVISKNKLNLDKINKLAN